MKRSRLALLLFMATFAGSLLAAGMAGGEGGILAQQFAGSSGSGGYCEFAYDPVDEEPYDSCEFSGQAAAAPAGVPGGEPWFDDDSLEYYDADTIGPARPLPPKVSASLNSPIYGVPAEDEISSETGNAEFDDADAQNQSQTYAPGMPAAQFLQDPITRAPYDLGPCTRHCWPEFFGDTDPEAELFFAPEIVRHVNRAALIVDLGLILDNLAGRSRAVSPADFVRRIDSPNDVATLSTGSSAGLGDQEEPITPDVETLAAWGSQAQDWIARQAWLAREVATINSRAQFYLQGLTPPPAPTLRIRLQWSKIDPLGRTHRFLSGVWAGYRNAAWGLSKGVQLLAGFPGVFNAPVRQAQDPAVRTRTSLRTPWRIDL